MSTAMKIEIPHSANKFEHLDVGTVFYCHAFGATQVAMKAAFHQDGSGPGIVYFTASNGKLVPYIADANSRGDLSTLSIPNVSISASGSPGNIREGISGVGALIVTDTGQKILRCSEAANLDSTRDVDLATGKISNIKSTAAVFCFVESALFVPSVDGKLCELVKIKSAP
jgi:hypothetical protein